MKVACGQSGRLWLRPFLAPALCSSATSDDYFPGKSRKHLFGNWDFETSPGLRPQRSCFLTHIIRHIYNITNQSVSWDRNILSIYWSPSVVFVGAHHTIRRCIVYQRTIDLLPKNDKMQFPWWLETRTWTEVLLVFSPHPRRNPSPALLGPRYKPGFNLLSSVASLFPWRGCGPENELSLRNASRSLPRHSFSVFVPEALVNALISTCPLYSASEKLRSFLSGLSWL